MAERNADVDEPRLKRFRIGINQGDVVFDDTRVYADGVNIAPASKPCRARGICISRKVYEDISGRMQLSFVDLGEQQLKNIAQPSVFIVSQVNSSRLCERPQGQLLFSLTSLQLQCFLSRT